MPNLKDVEKEIERRELIAQISRMLTPHPGPELRASKGGPVAALPIDEPTKYPAGTIIYAQGVDRPGVIEQVVPGAIRVAGQLVPWLGSGAGAEYLARAAEIGLGQRSSSDMLANLGPAMASQEILARVVPGGSGMMQGAARGAAMGAGTTLTQKTLEERRLPTRGEFLTGTLLGVALGGGAGKLNQIMKSRAERTQLAQELSAQLERQVQPTPNEIQSALGEVQARMTWMGEDVARAHMLDFPPEGTLPVEDMVSPALQQIGAQQAGADRFARNLMAESLTGSAAQREANQVSTSSLLEAAQSSIRPPVEPPLPETSSLLKAAQQTLTGQRGEVATNALLRAGTTATGGLIGGSIGDTPEDRIRNATLGAAVGLSVNPRRMAPVLSKWFGPKTAQQIVRTPSAPIEALTIKPPNTQGMHPFFDDSNAVTAEAVKQLGALSMLAKDEPTTQISKLIAKGFLNGELDADGLKYVMNKRGVTLPELLYQMPEEMKATMDEMKGLSYTQAYSQMGKSLGYLGYVRQTLNRMAKNDEVSQKLLEDMGQRTPEVDTFWSTLAATPRNVVNLWRGSMTGQLATTARNISSQTAATVTDIFDASLADALHFAGKRLGIQNERPMFGADYALNLAKTQAGQFRDGIESLTSFFQQMGPTQGRTLEALFAKMPTVDAKLFSTPTAEVALGEYTSLLNTLNTVQERFFRKASFEAGLRTWASRAKVPWDAVIEQPGVVPKEIYEQVINKALEVTFAAQPRGKFGREFLNWMAKSPGGMAYVLMPYPRFQANSLRFLIDHSPLGFARPLLGSKAPTAEVLSQALTGTTFFAGALAMRHNEDNAGEHWYTFKNVPGLKEGERLDVRAYNPYASYFALAEIAKQFAQGEIQMSPKDQALALGALSVPLRGGAGFSLLDIFAGKNTDVEDIPQALKVVAGNLLAGFSVPLRTVKDFLAGFEDEGGPNRTYTDSRISPLLGPTLSNLPQLHSPLPEELSQPAYTPLAAGPLNVDRPWMKQGLGLTVDNLNLAEQESARLAIPPSALFPKTGVPEVNSAIIREMGPVAEKMMATLVQSPGYQRLDQQQQRVLFQDMLKTARSIGQASAYGKQPSLYLDTLKKSLEHPSTFAEIEMNRAFNRR